VLLRGVLGVEACVDGGVGGASAADLSRFWGAEEMFSTSRDRLVGAILDEKMFMAYCSSSWPFRG
jgi:hypothetical protein